MLSLTGLVSSTLHLMETQKTSELQAVLHLLLKGPNRLGIIALMIYLYQLYSITCTFCLWFVYYISSALVSVLFIYEVTKKECVSFTYYMKVCQLQCKWYQYLPINYGMAYTWSTQSCDSFKLQICREVVS